MQVLRMLVVKLKQGTRNIAYKILDLRFHTCIESWKYILCEKPSTRKRVPWLEGLQQTGEPIIVTEQVLLCSITLTFNNKELT